MRPQDEFVQCIQENRTFFGESYVVACKQLRLTCLIIYVSSSISTALSSNRDFLFATKATKNSKPNQHLEFSNQILFENI